jgi:hypothetical protein
VCAASERQKHWLAAAANLDAAAAWLLLFLLLLLLPCWNQGHRRWLFEMG